MGQDNLAQKLWYCGTLDLNVCPLLQATPMQKAHEINTGPIAESPNK